MSQNIQAIYENGILRSLQQLDLPEGSIVRIKIIEILENSKDFIKDLSRFEQNESENLEVKIDD
jgi:predicted DNA-binding antitoxin AbrB/MazE fold protein